MPSTELYRFKNVPVVQQRTAESAHEARNAVCGDIVIARNLETGLITNEAFRPELMDYDSSYQSDPGHSATFQAHLVQVAGIVQKHFGGQKLIEVGCGKARFLAQLQSMGFDIIGLDPTYEGTNPVVIRDYFRPGLSLRGDAIVLRHVLEHIPDPVTFLRHLCLANGGGGRIYLEVPCFDWICEHRAWSDVTYEHVNYFRLPDFHRMFGRVLESGRIFHEQFLYVVADLTTIRTPRLPADDSFRFPPDFSRSIGGYAQTLREKPDFAVWGAASKGVMFALYMERAGAKVPHIVDINPAKQGKYLAGTGLRVSTPDEMLRILPAGADIVVMNGNYLEEVRRTTGNRYHYLVLNE